MIHICSVVQHVMRTGSAFFTHFLWSKMRARIVHLVILAPVAELVFIAGQAQLRRVINSAPGDMVCTWQYHFAHCHFHL